MRAAVNYSYPAPAIRSRHGGSSHQVARIQRIQRIQGQFLQAFRRRLCGAFRRVTPCMRVETIPQAGTVSRPSDGKHPRAVRLGGIDDVEPVLHPVLFVLDSVPGLPRREHHAGLPFEHALDSLHLDAPLAACRVDALNVETGLERVHLLGLSTAVLLVVEHRLSGGVVVPAACLRRSLVAGARIATA